MMLNVFTICGIVAFILGLVVIFVIAPKMDFVDSMHIQQGIGIAMLVFSFGFILEAVYVYPKMKSTSVNSSLMVHVKSSELTQIQYQHALAEMKNNINHPKQYHYWDIEAYLLQNKLTQRKR